MDVDMKKPIVLCDVQLTLLEFLFWTQISLIFRSSLDGVNLVRPHLPFYLVLIVILKNFLFDSVYTAAAKHFIAIQFDHLSCYYSLSSFLPQKSNFLFQKFFAKEILIFFHNENL